MTNDEKLMQQALEALDVDFMRNHWEVARDRQRAIAALQKRLAQPSKPLTDGQERKAFEQWYACNAFDYERHPLGSRECGLQWSAWKARAAHGTTGETK